jgi:hypothetical protein
MVNRLMDPVALRLTKHGAAVRKRLPHHSRARITQAVVPLEWLGTESNRRHADFQELCGTRVNLLEPAKPNCDAAEPATISQPPTLSPASLPASLHAFDQANRTEMKGPRPRALVGSTGRASHWVCRS